MGDLGYVAGSLIWMRSWELAMEGLSATYEVHVPRRHSGLGVGGPLPAGPVVAQASISQYFATGGTALATTSTALVVEANGDMYRNAAVYLKNMTQVTFAVHNCKALLNIFGFGAGASVFETPPQPPDTGPGPVLGALIGEGL
jgi:hypothetical protein